MNAFFNFSHIDLDFCLEWLTDFKDISSRLCLIVISIASVINNRFSMQIFDGLYNE